jgi:hypothetical protein
MTEGASPKVVPYWLSANAAQKLRENLPARKPLKYHKTGK